MNIILALCFGCSQPDIVAPVYKIHYPQSQTSSHKLISELKITTINNRSLIEVTSTSGIGSGTIRLVKGNWPETVVVHLHLKGLEGFTVTNGSIILDKSRLPVKAYNKNGNLYDEKYLLDEQGFI